MQVKKPLLFLLKSYGDMIILAFTERVSTLKRLHAFQKLSRCVLGTWDSVCATKGRIGD